MIHLLKVERRGGRLDDRDRIRAARAVTSSSSWLAGRTAYHAGEVGAAVALWRTAASANADRLRILALDEWGHRKQDEAIKTILVALEVQPSNELLTALLGSWRLSRKQITLLQQDLRAVLARAPRNATALVYQGWASHEAGSSSAGLADMERALALEPTNATVIRYLTRFLRETGGSRHRVERLLLDADRRWRDEGGFYYELAQFYIAEQRYTDAAPYVERLLAARPNDGHAREVVGIFYFMRGQYMTALEHYRTATRLVPTESRFYVDTGDALVRLGRRTEAVAAYTEAAKKHDVVGSQRLAELTQALKR